MTIATRSSLVIALALGFAAAFAAPGRAQGAEAETLFREGKRLMKKGQLARACEKFEAADRLDPTAGTEINLADCREKTGQLATAWAMFVKTAATAKRAGDGAREAEARRRAAALETQLVYLTIAVPDDSRTDGLVIKRNATVIDEGLWDQRVPVDPDEYTISAEAPGREPWSTSVVVKTRNKKVEVPVLDKRPEPKRAAATRPAAAESSEPGDARRPAEPSSFTGRRKLALTVAAIGVAAAGAGIGFGLEARSVERRADAICPASTCGYSSGVDLNKTARRDALYANIGFAAGGAAVIGAAILWFTGSPRPREVMSVVPSAGADRVAISLARSF
jgi:hypothetical protein